MVSIVLKEKGRRGFLKIASLFGISISSSIVPLFLGGCENDTTKSTNESVDLDISTKPALADINGSEKIAFGEKNNGRPLIIIRNSQNEFSVYTSVCTHAGCELNKPSEPGGDIVCPGPCGHGSHFTASDGTVVQGPASSPLKKFINTFNSSDNILTIYF
ncbi:MAG: Rieske 2Fe-2S domain-containing protein [Candidatus Latescibacteria bacterium]|nr:Rieske 2Fe-2S domain-containing protein [Candidatus Latescibacterota bacterium]